MAAPLAAPVRQAGSAAAGHESVRLGPVRSAAPTPAKPVSLDIDMLLDRAQLAVVLGVKNGFVDFPLQGQTPVERYNHVRLVPRGEGNVLGLVIQVWRDRTIADARGRYEGFTKSYPGAQTNRAVTSRTFTASYADTHYLGFFALGERTNIVLTCSAPSCSPDKLHKVALALKRNLPRWSRSVQ